MAVVSPFEYSVLIRATLPGFLLWRELPDVSTLIAAASGIYIVYREPVGRSGDKPR